MHDRHAPGRGEPACMYLLAGMQAAIAAAAVSVFSVGGVCAHPSGTLPSPTSGMLELVEGHLHQNASNLLAHVVQGPTTKDAMAALPPHVCPHPHPCGHPHPACLCSPPPTPALQAAPGPSAARGLV